MTDQQTQRLPDRLLDERDVARILNINLFTVRRWRFSKRGPKWLKISRCVRYSPEDLNDFLRGSRPDSPIATSREDDATGDPA